MLNVNHLIHYVDINYLDNLNSLYSDLLMQCWDLLNL